MSARMTGKFIKARRLKVKKEEEKEKEEEVMHV